MESWTGDPNGDPTIERVLERQLVLAREANKRRETELEQLLTTVRAAARQQEDAIVRQIAHRRASREAAANANVAHAMSPINREVSANHLLTTDVKLASIYVNHQGAVPLGETGNTTTLSAAPACAPAVEESHSSLAFAPAPAPLPLVPIVHATPSQEESSLPAHNVAKSDMVEMPEPVPADHHSDQSPKSILWAAPATPTAMGWMGRLPIATPTTIVPSTAPASSLVAPLATDEPAATETVPVDPAPVQAAPVQPAPFEAPASLQPAPSQPAQAQPAPVEATPIEPQAKPELFQVVEPVQLAPMEPPPPLPELLAPAAGTAVQPALATSGAVGEPVDEPVDLPAFRMSAEEQAAQTAMHTTHAIFAEGAHIQNAAQDPELSRLASKMGGKAPPSTGSWLSVLCQMAQEWPVAFVISDMRVPGIPIKFANAAALALTGHAAHEIMGNNCRILQGPRTEGAAVRQMTTALRTAAPVMLRVSNYRKDGELFKNVLSLQPVLDSEGTYRYSIGLQCDEANWPQQRATFEKLRKLLPTRVDVRLQPTGASTAALQVDAEAQTAQWRTSITKFTRLVWSMDWEGSLSRFLRSRDMFLPLLEWATRKYPDAAAQLELLYRTVEMDALPPAQRGARAGELCARYLGGACATGDEALARLAAYISGAHEALAAELLPRFVQTKACMPVIEKLVTGKAAHMASAAQAIWSEYEMPADVAGWLNAFVPVAEQYPACIVISDMTIPGNPMLYVNPEFCRVTEYAKLEVLGRNCRFLQGPKTEPQSVAVIQDTLRRGVDCHVKITNYKRSGDLFINLLTMRPVHDTNGVLRFCIGVQFEVQHSDPTLKQRLARLSKMVSLLPKTLAVASPAVGHVHKRDEVSEEACAPTDTKLLAALDGSKKVYTTEAILHDAGHYAGHHADQMAHVQKLAAAAAVPSMGVTPAMMRPKSESPKRLSKKLVSKMKAFELGQKLSPVRAAPRVAPGGAPAGSTMTVP